MRLYNADGTTAEMSGNGIRCLVRAWARRNSQERGDVVVDTASGPPRSDSPSNTDEQSMIATVDMGPIIHHRPSAGVALRRRGCRGGLWPISAWATRTR